MAQNGGTKPIPVLLALLVCDVAVADPSTGKKNLIGIFDKVFVAKFPTARQASLYIKLTDALGRYGLLIEFVHSNKSAKLGEAKGEFMASSALESVDAYVPFPPLPIPEPGRYEFRLFADSVYLGSAFIDAVAASYPVTPPEEKK
ncbi:MAG: DUF6941 family protein [Vicinamibacteria bacterium]